MSEAIVNLTSSNFDEVVLQSSKVVVVDFWAPWCGPCRAIAPILDLISKEMPDTVQITKVNMDNELALGQRFQVRSIPTLLFFADGELKAQVVGLVQKEAIVRKIQELDGQRV